MKGIRDEVIRCILTCDHDPTVLVLRSHICPHLRTLEDAMFPLQRQMISRGVALRSSASSLLSTKGRLYRSFSIKPDASNTVPPSATLDKLPSQRLGKGDRVVVLGSGWAGFQAVSIRVSE